MKDKILFVMAFMCVMVLASCGGDNGGSSSSSGGYSYPTTIYDVLDINGAKYACYGYRSPVTFESAWNLTTHSGKLRLPCGTLAKAESGTHDYDYMFYIHLKGNKDLGKGSKLEDFSPKFEPVSEGEINYVSGFATVTDKKNNDYITIKFESFKFGSGSKTYILNGTVQLMIGESGDNSGGNGGGSSSTYYMDVHLNSSAQSQIIELTNLETSVSKISSSASWLIVSKQPYSSGSPKIKIDATANTSSSSRECKVTVIASDDNEVVITVVQKGHSQPQTNDEVSDKDALSREL